MIYKYINICKGFLSFFFLFKWNQIKMAIILLSTAPSDDRFHVGRQDWGGEGGGGGGKREEHMQTGN